MSAILETASTGAVQAEAAKEQQAEVVDVTLPQSFACLRGVCFEFADAFAAAVAAQLDDLS